MLRNAASEFAPARSSRGPRPSYQLALEALEERVVLSVTAATRSPAPPPSHLVRHEDPSFQNIPQTPQPTKRFSAGTRQTFGYCAAGLRFLAAVKVVGAGYCLSTPEPVISKGAAVALGVVGVVTGATASFVGDLAKDPPDSNFKHIAKVHEHEPLHVRGHQDGLPPKLATALNRLLANQAKESAVQEALMTSMNRADGAQLAGQAGAERRQVRAINKYRKQLSKLLFKDATLRVKAARVAAGVGFPLAVPVTADQVTAVQQDVAANGLPAALVAQLAKLKVTDPELDALRQAVVVQSPATVAGVRDLFADPAVLQALRDAASGLRE